MTTRRVGLRCEALGSQTTLPPRHSTSPALRGPLRAAGDVWTWPAREAGRHLGLRRDMGQMEPRCDHAARKGGKRGPVQPSGHAHLDRPILIIKVPSCAAACPLTGRPHETGLKRVERG